MSMKLSGKTRYVHFKPLLRSPRLVLQVEIVGTVPDNCDGTIDMRDVRYWRDATVEDLSEFFVKELRS